MRVIMAGGGTGGHLFPGLAVARALKERNDMVEILFVGSARGIESRVLPRAGFPLETLPIRGLTGRGARGVAEALVGVPASVARALKIIRRFGPDFVLGLGGYASGPMLLAASLRRIPCAIMEQNLRPGLTNRLLGRCARRIFVAYEETRAFFSSPRVIVSGNPVRWRELPQVPRSEKFTLFIFGGSAGAHKINLCALEALAALSDLAPAWRIIHQTGEADFAWVAQAYRKLSFAAEVFPFIEKMDEAYAAADLIVCRAGATTIAELTAYGKPAVLVPYPFAAHDHQRWNAEALTRQGAAEMILDRELSGPRLAETLRALYRDRDKIASMAAQARKLGKPEAADTIAEECLKLAAR
ncbi:MAG TPA: undecaprenyldiphospho-muramoylpentapeptide beta-N-acetylglucosaminyltransferase [Candidatus Acidoferrales bacterium]|nr:undecaprenyldiphospho-muramoylpentapeptide beta-N-acetylglucosaminyltransferase [Candidatus Acidoferrales bacterium]